MTTSRIDSRHVPRNGPDGGKLLRRWIGLDAIASGALGIGALVAAPALPELLGIPAVLGISLGLFLALYAVALWIIRSRPRVSRPAVWVVIVGNLVWVAVSIAAVAAGWLVLTAAGTALVLAQAFAVALFAELQIFGLRRAQPVTS